MRGSHTQEGLGRIVQTRRNKKCKDPETKLNLKCVRDRNKAGVVQMQELRRKVKDNIKGASKEQIIQDFLGFEEKFVF